MKVTFQKARILRQSFSEITVLRRVFIDFYADREDGPGESHWNHRDAWGKGRARSVGSDRILTENLVKQTELSRFPAAGRQLHEAF